MIDQRVILEPQFLPAASVELAAQVHTRSDGRLSRLECRRLRLVHNLDLVFPVFTKDSGSICRPESSVPATDGPV